MGNTSSEKWLVRSEKNQITGPYTREQLRQMILQGQFDLQDEVCAGNSYWIALNEADEVRTQLDVTVPLRAKKIDEEDTQTETVHSMPVEPYERKLESSSLWKSSVFLLLVGALIFLMMILSRLKT